MATAVAVPESADAEMNRSVLVGGAGDGVEFTMENGAFLSPLAGELSSERIRRLMKCEPTRVEGEINGLEGTQANTGGQ